MKTSLQNYIKNNGYVITVLYIVLLIIILMLLFREEDKKYIKELFQNQNDNSSQTSETSNTEEKKRKNKSRTIYNIIPSPLEDNLYFGTYISLSKKTQNDNDNMVYTRSLESNKWIYPGSGGKLSDTHIIVDLIFDNHKRLFAVGMEMIDGKPSYDLFKKESTDFKSKWQTIPSNKKIKSLCYDLTGNKLLGISSYDGQIYESGFVSDLSYGKWIGPINFDKPMRKVMFDKDGIMIGIGLLDGYIYKKKGDNWRIDKWDVRNVNKTEVYDLVYDVDGCFIASTPHGVMKQLHPEFSSEFVKLADFNQKHETILEKPDILKYKTGYENIEDDFDTSTELGSNLRRVYEFKKLSKDLCGKRNVISDNKINSDDQIVNSEVLSKQNREINDLYSMIENLTNKLDL